MGTKTCGAGRGTGTTEGMHSRTEIERCAMLRLTLPDDIGCDGDRANTSVLQPWKHRFFCFPSDLRRIPAQHAASFAITSMQREDYSSKASV